MNYLFTSSELLVIITRIFVICHGIEFNPIRKNLYNTLNIVINTNCFDRNKKKTKDLFKACILYLRLLRLKRKNLLYMQ